ncbi:defensin Ec-AMP-D1 [Amborella trichopoda]|uniref:defensin Ec-AMP-D1 n=1 Tax=Amborella trichopoda TaxID=13333 RepID=UPI0005D2F124|nr:defensin Ec-AMP-D1 [Amborella trichopoda]|eukprot:XP_011626671.1 defensin Ec-AMP-D1 [Amborella trichopoda]
MEGKRSVLPASLLVLLLLVAASAVVVDARTCQSLSHHFKGRCVLHNNCGYVCRTEGFIGGKCRGFRGRCFCLKPC